MLEKLNTPSAITISLPKASVVKHVSELVTRTPSPIFAEIGVGIGATTLQVAKLLNNRGEIHIFDFDANVAELKKDLQERGFHNIHAHGNSAGYWDSYHWSLAGMLKAGVSESFDAIYIDGSHTYLHDALAFFMADRLLKVGGMMIFDDWDWKYAQSQWMKSKRRDLMTEEQEHTAQVGYILDTLVRDHVGYDEVVTNEMFRKVRSTVKPR